MNYIDIGHITMNLDHVEFMQFDQHGDVKINFNSGEYVTIKGFNREAMRDLFRITNDLPYPLNMDSLND